VKQNTLESFIPHKKASKGEQKAFKNIKIPKDYDPVQGARKRLKVSEQSKRLNLDNMRRRNLSVKQRAGMLGEKFTSSQIANLKPKDEALMLKTQNFMSKLSDRSKNLLLGNNKFVLSSAQQSKTDE
jgi:hypothetical protein